MAQKLEASESLSGSSETPVNESQHYTKARGLLTSSLEQIVAEPTIALQQADLHFQFFLAVPSGGDSILNFACFADPSDEDWDRARDIIINIVETKTGMDGLCGRDLPCAASDALMGASEILLPSADTAIA